MNIKKHIIVNMVISMLIGIVTGVILICLAGHLNASLILKWSLIIIGLFVIMVNVPSLITGIFSIGTGFGIADIIFSVLGMVMGCMMIFEQGTVMTVIVSAYMIAFPLVRILLSSDKAGCFKREWIKILFGVVMLLFLPVLLHAADRITFCIFTIAGWGAIALSVMIFLVSLFRFLYKSKKSSEGVFYVPYDDNDNK